MAQRQPTEPYTLVDFVAESARGLGRLSSRVRESSARFLAPPPSLASYLQLPPRVRQLAASPAVQRTVKLARPALDSLLQLTRPADHEAEPRSLLHALVPSKYSSSPAASLTAAAALVTAVALLLAMSWRTYLGGRYSPFASGPPPTGPPRVTDDDYHYLGPDDIVDPPAAYATYGLGHGPRRASRPGGGGGAAADEDDASKPDVLLLKHRGTTYELLFPAYSISDGILRVGDLRRYAADKTGAPDPRRVKLLYKGHVLKDDAAACCEEGLKQNSELMCVVSEAGPQGSSSAAAAAAAAAADNSESASEDDFARARAGRRPPPPGPRVNVDGTLADDGRSHRPAQPPRAAEAEKRPDPSRTLNPTPAATDSPAVGPSPSGSPKPQPRTPGERLDVITDTLRITWAPRVRQYIASPPRDAKARQQEYTKLSESILQHVLLKLDDIITDGDADLRTRRKAMIVETQKVLSDLDAAKGGKGQ